MADKLYIQSVISKKSVKKDMTTDYCRLDISNKQAQAKRNSYNLRRRVSKWSKNFCLGELNCVILDDFLTTISEQHLIAHDGCLKILFQGLIESNIKKGTWYWAMTCEV